jgi:hypothetical protein
MTVNYVISDATVLKPHDAVGTYPRSFRANIFLGAVVVSSSYLISVISNIVVYLGVTVNWVINRVYAGATTATVVDCI